MDIKVVIEILNNAYNACWRASERKELLGYAFKGIEKTEDEREQWRKENFESFLKHETFEGMGWNDYIPRDDDGTFYPIVKELKGNSIKLYELYKAKDFKKLNKYFAAQYIADKF